MKLRFTLRAAENLADIADYIHTSNPSGARRVRTVIYQTLQNLILFPHVGRSQQVEGVRKVVTRRFGYLIYYCRWLPESGNRWRNREWSNNARARPDLDNKVSAAAKACRRSFALQFRKRNLCLLVWPCGYVGNA
jgi:toxin ParE1/3/4